MSGVPRDYNPHGVLPTRPLSEALEWLEGLSTGKAWAFCQSVENERAYARTLLAAVKVEEAECASRS